MLEVALTHAPVAPLSSFSAHLFIPLHAEAARLVILHTPNSASHFTPLLLSHQLLKCEEWGEILRVLLLPLPLKKPCSVSSEKSLESYEMDIKQKSQMH